MTLISYVNVANHGGQVEFAVVRIRSVVVELYRQAIATRSFRDDAFSIRLRAAALA